MGLRGGDFWALASLEIECVCEIFMDAEHSSMLKCVVKQLIPKHA